MNIEGVNPSPTRTPTTSPQAARVDAVYAAQARVTQGAVNVATGAAPAIAALSQLVLPQINPLAQALTAATAPAETVAQLDEGVASASQAAALVESAAAQALAPALQPEVVAPTPVVIDENPAGSAPALEVQPEGKPNDVLATQMSTGYNPNEPVGPPPVPEKPQEVQQTAPSFPTHNDSLPLEASLQNTSAPSPKPRTPGKSVREYVATVAKRAEDTNRAFQRRRVPYRFRVYTVGGQRVLLDLSILNDKGAPVQKLTRDVTDVDFGKLMDDVSEGKGLFFDNQPSQTSYY